jgi:hypothetical protein
LISCRQEVSDYAVASRFDLEPSMLQSVDPQWKGRQRIASLFKRTERGG